MSPAGRPEIGGTINVRLGDALLGYVNAYAFRQSVSRAQAIRSLIEAAFAELDEDTIASYP